MSYSQSVYQKANTALERRREQANLEAQLRSAEIEKKLPELAEIQNRLSRIGFKISEVFLYGRDKEAEMDALRRESLALQQEKKELLKKNGYGEDALSVKYICPVCRDTGYVKDRLCRCHRELLKEIEKDEIRKIAPIDECTFAAFLVEYFPEEIQENGVSPRLKAKKILESCHKYAQSFTSHSPNLMFMGKTGLGKTHLSLAIANVVINKGYSVVYGTAHHILSDLQNENFGRAENLTYYERQVLYCDLLILDDLGAEYTNNYTVACIYNIINSRILAKRPTIISTNFGFDDLNEKYDQRITSRIAGEYSVLILEGNDIRYMK